MSRGISTASTPNRASRAKQAETEEETYYGIGSRYRLLAETHEMRTFQKDRDRLFKSEDSFDLSLYLEDIADDPKSLAKKELKRSQTNQQFIVAQKKETMQRAVERDQNPHVQSAKMLSRIVDYSVAKHAVDTVGPLESEVKVVQ